MTTALTTDKGLEAAVAAFHAKLIEQTVIGWTTPEDWREEVTAAVEADRAVPQYDREGFDSPIAHALAGALRDRGSVRAAVWLGANQDDDALWGMVGNLLDEIERVAGL